MQLTEQKPHIAPDLKYCLYCRKSSEEDERQALSIDSQMKEMTALAKRERINIVEIRKESFSAKESGQRQVFAQLLTDIGLGKFNAILTWAPDRLSRNAGDLGSIVDLMDRGGLLEIRTHSQRFTNSPNEKFLFMILCSQAKLENDNRGINVKRGLKTKVEIGWRPGMPPLGYLNEKSINRGQNKIFIDEKRAPIIKTMFEKVAYERKTGRDIQIWLQEINFTTRGDKSVTLSSVYYMLRNSFYYGVFEYPEGSGNTYKGAHEPLITKELFDRVQDRLSVPNKGVYGQKEFLFTKVFKCGSCGSGFTAEEKIKKIKSDESIRRYVYYRCTQSRDPVCREPPISENDLLKEIEKLLNEIDLNEISLRKQIETEMSEYQNALAGVFGDSNIDAIVAKIDLRQFVINRFRTGSREQKRSILGLLKHQLEISHGGLKFSPWPLAAHPA